MFTSLKEGLYTCSAACSRAGMGLSQHGDEVTAGGAPALSYACCPAHLVVQKDHKCSARCSGLWYVLKAEAAAEPVNEQKSCIVLLAACCQCTPSCQRHGMA